MSVAAALVEGTRPAVNADRLHADLRALGVQAGQTLLVHASLSRVGWVEGGARTVVAALRAALGPDGTLVAGAGTPENSITSRAHRAETEGFTPAQAVGYRGRMPAFDRENTPTSVGAVAEALRTTPRAVRSDHPQTSFTAIGRNARQLMEGHRLTCHYGENSPLAKLYRQDASILLLGVGFNRCTAFHLAEYRYTERPPLTTYSCVVRSKGKRRWLTYQDVVLDDDEFDILGKSLNNEIKIPAGNVAQAPSRLISLRCAVDFAVDWMAARRRLPRFRPEQAFPTLGPVSYICESYLMSALPAARLEGR